MYRRDSTPPPIPPDDLEVQPELGDEPIPPSLIDTLSQAMDNNTNSDSNTGSKINSGRNRYQQKKGNSTTPNNDSRPIISSSNASKSPGITALLLHAVGAFKVFVFVVGMIAVFVTMFWGYSSVRSLFTYQTNSTTDISVVVTAVEACGEMTTYRAYFESIADFSEEGWIWNRKFAVIFGGTVDCGFDMRKAKAEIFENEKRIEVTLPHCHVLGANIDIKTMRVYDEKGSHKLEEQNAVIVRAKEEIEQRATKEWNVLVLAEDNAVKLYKDFLRSFNYEVSVIFTDDESKLNVPSGSKRDTMKGGGVLVVHTAPEKESKEVTK